MRKKYDVGPVEVVEVLDHSLAALTSQIRESSCEVIPEIPDDLPIVRANAASLTHCVRNLVSNALKYGNSSGQSAIQSYGQTAERRGSGLASSITDQASIPRIGRISLMRNELRRSNINTPILMLTARDHVDDKILGFKSGADDYLTKPFDMNELRVRVEALIRRSGRGRQTEFREYTFGDVRVVFEELLLARPGRTTSLSDREGRLLRYLIENRGKVISRDTLLEQVWGYNTAPCTRTVDVHIVRLRQKIEDDPKNPRFIVTVHRLGYRFDG